MERPLLSLGLDRLAASLTRWMITRSLRTHFRSIYLSQQTDLAAGQSAILFANHHYWWDGYLAYWLVYEVWHRRGITWMQEWRRFPPFGLLGALPFPPHQPMKRMATIRRTLHQLQKSDVVLVLFPEGVLHRSGTLLPFQRSLYWLAQQVKGIPLLPLAIYIEPRYHQYPCAYMSVGAPFHSNAPQQEWLLQAQATLQQELNQLCERVEHLVTHEQHLEQGFKLALQGKLSLDERYPDSWGVSRDGSNI